MKIKLRLLTLVLFVSATSFAQFSADAEFRPRTEYRHGYGSIIPETADPGYGISTRVRLNTVYKSDAYSFYLSIQDVLVWGENRQILQIGRAHV